MDDTPGWCRNLIDAGRLQPGEHVLVMVDEPLVEQGSQLAQAVRQAGGSGQALTGHSNTLRPA